ncbi:MAG: hypothetical protein ABI970_15830 [Chloroflexota bacterium]
MMNLQPKRKNGEPRPFPLKIIAAVIVLVVILGIIVVLQISARKPVSPSPVLANGLTEGDLFGTAMFQMATSKALGTPLDSSSPLILTAKAIVVTPKS